MGLGISQLIPYIIYGSAFLVAIIAFFRPFVGVLFLFPLLPYQIIFEKIKNLPMGNNINDLIIFSTFLGTLIAGNKDNQSDKLSKGLQLPIVFVCIFSFIGLINALSKGGFLIDQGTNYIADWKNYMLLPLIWFLTFKNLKDKKTFDLMLFIMLLGILGAGYYFYTNIKWMNTWHYSNRMRTMMEGLFVYLGANHYGAFFAHFLFIVLGLFFYEKKLFRKVSLVGLVCLTGYSLVYTYSRGAYLALIVGILLLGILKDRKILIVLFLFLIFWRSLVPLSVVERIDMTRQESGELEDSAAIRIGLWQAATQMFYESPLIGKGFNTFQYTYKGEVWRDTHNYYLKMLVELGILGCLSFVWLLISTFILGWRLYREAPEGYLKGLGLGFSVCVVSVSITNFFGDRWSFLSLGSYFWIFLGMVTRAMVSVKSGMYPAVVNKQGEK